MLSNRRIVAYVITGGLAVLAPIVLRSPFLRDILVLSVIFMMLTFSLDLLVSGTGLLSFGHQTFFALGGYTSAILALKLGVPPLMGFLAGFIVGGLIGFIVGYIALRNLRATYLAIVTLSLSLIGHWVWMSGYSTQWGLGGVFGLVDLPGVVIKIPFLSAFEFKSELSYYYLALFFLLVTIYIVHRWRRSKFGRAGIALRENEALASSIGIQPHFVLTMVFSLSTALAGLTGAVYGHYVHAVHPWMFMPDYMLIIMVCLFMGGPGTLGGPVVGTIIYFFVVDPLQISGPLKLFILGVILFVFIRFMPEGVYPVLKSVFVNIARRLRTNGG